MDLRQLDKRYFGRHGEPEDLVVGNSADSNLTDARGRRYIDFMMGWCVGNLGWGNTTIRAAARKFDGPVTFIQTTYTVPGSSSPKCWPA